MKVSPTPAEPQRQLHQSPPGHYTLIVKGSNNDGIWSEPIMLQIQVLPPFWKTWWAYTLVLFWPGLVTRVLCSPLLPVDRHWWRGTIHSPSWSWISLPISPMRSERIFPWSPGRRKSSWRKTNGNTAEKQLLQTIKSNSESLLQLVNELMDFRKAETGHLVLHAGSQRYCRVCSGPSTAAFAGHCRLTKYRTIQYSSNAESYRTDALIVSKWKKCWLQSFSKCVQVHDEWRFC